MCRYFDIFIPVVALKPHFACVPYNSALCCYVLYNTLSNLSTIMKRQNKLPARHPPLTDKRSILKMTSEIIIDIINIHININKKHVWNMITMHENLS